jgi:cytochrome P450
MSIELFTGTKLAVAVLAFFVFLLLRRKPNSSGLPLPPGPAKLPILGNFLSLPKSSAWASFAWWGRQFKSDVIHLDVFGTSIIVLNSAKAAQDLLEKKASIYSSRPSQNMLNKLMGWDWNVANMPYGESWRHHRSLLQLGFRPKTAFHYQPQEVKSTHKLLRQILDTPQDLFAHARHSVTTTLMSVAYGIDVSPRDDPYVETARKALHGGFTAGVPGTFLVDYFSFLRFVPEWFPGAGFKTQAKEWKKNATDMVEIPFEVVKRRMENSTAERSFTSMCLEDLGEENDPYQELIIKESAAAIVAGGSDTLTSAFLSFVYAMMTHPEVQQKAQQEIDEVIGNDRLPEFSDEASLPYIGALVTEVLRWKTTAPICVPHMLTEDDTYNGYHLPANSIVIANSWAILHDEQSFPDAFAFTPERFLKDNKTPDTKNKNLTNAIFGFGRRECPGRSTATSSLWLMVASVLATFDIKKPRGVNGKDLNETEPEKYSFGVVNMPLPFQCDILPRSRGASELVKATA